MDDVLEIIARLESQGRTAYAASYFERELLRVGLRALTHPHVGYTDEELVTRRRITELFNCQFPEEVR